MLRIGISACILHRGEKPDLWNGRPLLYVEQSMATWLLNRGVRAYLIPFAEPPEADASQANSSPVTTSPADQIDGLDGLVLQGGADMAPDSYGSTPLRDEWSGDAARDAYELALVDAALQKDVPVLGICRGLQVLNVARGGSLVQDIDSQVDGAISHRDADAYAEHTHEVIFEPDSRLAEVYAEYTSNGRRLAAGRIVSVHHQAIDRLGDGLVVEARSPDGLIEAVRLAASPDNDSQRGSDNGPWAAGVQWHPEFQPPDDSSLLPTTPLLEDFLSACRTRSSSSLAPRRTDR